MKFNLRGAINQLGYGCVTYNILKATLSAGHEVSYFPIGEPQWAGDPDAAKLINAGLRNADIFDVNAPSILVWHQFALDLFPSKNRIGWPIFELDDFTPKEKHHMRSCDGLIVCSQWAKEIVKEAVGIDSKVVPLGVDTSIFKIDEKARLSRPGWTKDTTVFINVGKWEKRKGHFELLEAFNKAFEPTDDVELWMINENPFIGRENEEWRGKYASSKMGNHVKFFPRLEKHEHLAKLFNHVDCVVAPSHAEGFNFEPLEAMACGAHVIATRYSGHTEYLNDANARLLDVTGMELAHDGRWFNGQGKWATFNIEQLVEHMRTIHSMKQNGQLGINTVGAEHAKGYDWAHIASLLVSSI